MTNPVSRPTGAARRIRCEIHDLSYNPATTTGCALCAADSARRSGGLPVSPLTAVGVLGVAAVLIAGVAKAGTAFADRGDTVYRESSETAGKLDPESFRPLIVAVEDQVFPSGPIGFDHGSAIFKASMDLSDAIRRTSEGNPFQDAVLVDHSREVLSFGQMMSASSDIGYAAFDLSMAQREWSALREKVFLPADWFTPFEDHTPTPAAGDRTEPTTDPAAARALADMALEMENLIRFANSTAMGIGEPTEARDNWERRRLNDQWQNFRTAIGGRLRSVLAAIPEGRYRLTPNARSAHQSLESSANTIASMVQSNSLPTRARREQFIAQAERSLGQAKEMLERM